MVYDRLCPIEDGELWQEVGEKPPIESFSGPLLPDKLFHDRMDGVRVGILVNLGLNGGVKSGEYVMACHGCVRLSQIV